MRASYGCMVATVVLCACTNTHAPMAKQERCVPHLPKTCVVRGAWFCTCLRTRVGCTRAHITTAHLHKDTHMSMAGAQHTPMQLSRTLEPNTAVCPTRTKGCGRGVAVDMHSAKNELTAQDQSAGCHNTHRGVSRGFIPLHHINSKPRKLILCRCAQPCPGRSAPRPGSGLRALARGSVSCSRSEFSIVCRRAGGRFSHN
jgi:hypothetical protein